MSIDEFFIPSFFEGKLEGRRDGGRERERERERERGRESIFTSYFVKTQFFGISFQIFFVHSQINIFFHYKKEEQLKIKKYFFKEIDDILALEWIKEIFLKKL